MTEGIRYALITGVILVISLIALLQTGILQDFLGGGGVSEEYSIMNQRAILLQAAEELREGERRTLTFAMPEDYLLYATNEYCDINYMRYYDTDLNREVQLSVPESCVGQPCVCYCRNNNCNNCIEETPNFFSDEAFYFFVGANDILEERCPALPSIQRNQNREGLQSNLASYEIVKFDIGAFICQEECDFDYTPLVRESAIGEGNLNEGVNNAIRACTEQFPEQLDLDSLIEKLNSFDPLAISYENGLNILYGLGIKDSKLVYFKINEELNDISFAEIESEYFETNKQDFFADLDKVPNDRRFNVISLPEKTFTIIDRFDPTNTLILFIEENADNTNDIIGDDAEINSNDAQGNDVGTNDVGTEHADGFNIIESNRLVVSSEEMIISNSDIEISIDQSNYIFFNPASNKVYTQYDEEIVPFEERPVTGRYNCRELSENPEGGEIVSLNIHNNELFVVRRFDCSSREHPIDDPDYFFKANYFISTMEFGVDITALPAFMFDSINPPSNMPTLSDLHRGYIEQFNRENTPFSQDSYHILGLANNGEETIYLFYIENEFSDNKYTILHHKSGMASAEYQPFNFILQDINHQVSKDDQFCYNEILPLEDTSTAILFNENGDYVLKWRSGLTRYQSNLILPCVYHNTQRGLFLDERIESQADISLDRTQQISVAYVNGNVCWYIDHTHGLNPMQSGGFTEIQ